MTDHKFTDDDVIKALECSVEHNERKNASCDGCPLEKVFPYCNRECSEDTLDVMYLALINRQKAEIDRLQAVHADMTESLRLASEANKDMQAEIERLETENKLLIKNDVRNKYPNCVSVAKGRIYTRTLEDYDELIGDISAEAIKDFAQRLKASKIKPEFPWDDFFVTEDTIDTLVKEMTEEKTNEFPSEST